MNVYVSSSWRKLEGFDEVMKEVKFKSLKDPEGFTRGFWKRKLSNPMKDLQNLRRVAEKVPNSRAIRLRDIHVFALPMSPPMSVSILPTSLCGRTYFTRQPGLLSSSPQVFTDFGNNFTLKYHIRRMVAVFSFRNLASFVLVGYRLCGLN